MNLPKSTQKNNLIFLFKKKKSWPYFILFLLSLVLTYLDVLFLFYRTYFGYLLKIGKNTVILRRFGLLKSYIYIYIYIYI